jgi:hypothetical protein
VSYLPQIEKASPGDGGALKVPYEGSYVRVTCYHRDGELVVKVSKPHHARHYHLVFDEARPWVISDASWTANAETGLRTPETTEKTIGSSNAPSGKTTKRKALSPSKATGRGKNEKKLTVNDNT